MKNPMFWLIAVAVVALGVFGIGFLNTASQVSLHLNVEGARTPSLVAGITCLVLATGLLVLGVFVFRKGE